MQNSSNNHLFIALTMITSKHFEKESQKIYC